jgi:endonuclease YncB( thermonuclease family)
MGRFEDMGPRVRRRFLRLAGTRWIPVAVVAILLATAPFAAGPGVAGDLPPAGAPPPGSGSIELPWARVIDGDTLEAWIGGSRVGIGLIGVQAPRLNSACGEEAAVHLERLVAAGMRLDEDPALVLDRRLRRMYDVVTPEGGSVAEALVWAGVARARREGGRGPALQALQQQARAARRGCLWQDR